MPAADTQAETQEDIYSVFYNRKRSLPVGNDSSQRYNNVPCHVRGNVKRRQDCEEAQQKAQSAALLRFIEQVESDTAEKHRIAEQLKTKNLRFDMQQEQARHNKILSQK